jgi:hypothetical protein
VEYGTIQLKQKQTIAIWNIWNVYEWNRYGRKKIIKKKFKLVDIIKWSNIKWKNNPTKIEIYILKKGKHGDFIREMHCVDHHIE